MLNKLEMNLKSDERRKKENVEFLLFLIDELFCCCCCCFQLRTFIYLFILSVHFKNVFVYYCYYFKFN